MTIAHAAPVQNPRFADPATRYHGAPQVIAHHHTIGPVKAALDASVRQLVTEPGPQGIRVHALSPGPTQTRAASGIDHVDESQEQAANSSPCHHLVSINDVGAATAGLVSDWARHMAGKTVLVDGGGHVRA